MSLTMVGNFYTFHIQQLIKYGVVERACLEQELQNWPHLYLAGRMHKPIEVRPSKMILVIFIIIVIIFFLKKTKKLNY